MYILAGNIIEVYKNVDIYDGDYIHIFTQPKGKGRIDFNSVSDAKEYIDGLQPSEPIYHTYRVNYINSVRDLAYIDVRARNERIAERIARAKLHSEFKSLHNITQLD